MFKVDIYANETFVGTKFVEAHDEEEAQDIALEYVSIDLDVEEV